jgi:hypothetical protein
MCLTTSAKGVHAVHCFKRVTYYIFYKRYENLENPICNKVLQLFYLHKLSKCITLSL